MGNSKSMLDFTVDDGFLEGLINGHKNGILREGDYNNLSQCASLDDVKVHLASTDYGQFLQNESVISSRLITEKALEKLVEDFNMLRFNATEPLATFLDFITYEYMISNILKLITGARNGRETLELMYKCHPLGMFDTLGALTACSNVDDMYEMVLIDSPIGKFFTKTDRRDFDEFSMEYIRSLLLKNYYQAFYDYCQTLGGITGEVMGKILSFEADRTVITITRNTFGVKELPNDERLKLFPNFGSLINVHEDLSQAEDDDTVREILKPFKEYSKMYNEILDNPEVSLETKFLHKAVELNKEAFTQQFHYGVFYSWLKLKEQEINNIMWISECIHQDMKDRLSEYIKIYN